MAILTQNTSMVYWKIYHGDNNTDITDILSGYVSSIRINKTALPVAHKNKKSAGELSDSPSKAVIEITSNNYVEEIFVEGVQIKITMGYEKLVQPTVFEGRIQSLPEGSAKDMLNYTVIAYGIETDLAGEQKNRTFKIPTKTEIISQIAMENGYIWNISIADKAPMKSHFMPVQKKETDYEFIMRCAKAWNCLCWFTITPTGKQKQLNFADANIAYELSDGTLEDRSIYELGYRTDKYACNVEVVKWSHQNNALSNGGAGISGFGEFGKVTGDMEWRIVYDNKTWILKEELRNLFKRKTKDTSLSGGISIAKDIFKVSTGLRYGLNSARNYKTFQKYFVIEKYNDNSSKSSVPPSGQGGGFKIQIVLNEGDPTLRPPRDLILYSGCLNPKTDSAELPLWLNRAGLGKFARLKINETSLNYSNGRIISNLTCSMGEFGE